MANRASTTSPLGPGAVVKVTPSGFLGPAGVDGAASVGAGGPAVAELLDGVDWLSFFGSKTQLLPTTTRRTRTHSAARARTALPERPFFGGSVLNAHSLVQLVPSKYRCSPWPTPAGSGYQPGADFGGGGACSGGISPVSS